MDSAWFDRDDLDFPSLRRGSVVRARSHWTSTSGNHVGQSSVSSSSSHLSFLEHSLERDIHHRLRETSRIGQGTRRLGLAERFDSLMRNTSDGGRFQLRDDDELSKNFEAVKEENLKLQAVITDLIIRDDLFKVTEVNKRWQKYNNDRQMYVQRLLTTIQDQQEQMNKTVESRLLLSKERSNLEDGDILSEKSRLLEEVRDQRSRLESLEREYREHVAVLEFQVKAHRDDWEAERSEKQQVLKDKMAAEAKVRLLQKDVRCLKLKLREERQENANLCSCCHTYETDTTACPSSVLGRQNTACQSHNGKTYRTSVHLPCTSSQLLPRGTTMHFNDDVTIDSEKIALNSDKRSQAEGLVRSASISEDESEAVAQNNFNEPSNECEPSVKRIPDTKEEASRLKSSLKRTNFLPKSSRGKTEKSEESATAPEIVEPTEKVYQSVSQPNLTVHSTKVSSSVLHITPSQNSSTASLQLDPADGAVDGASGVCIGFNNGLASVLTFPQSPIVKSFSLPTSRGGDSVSVKSFVPLTQPSSLDSSWCALPIASPPSYATSSESVASEKKTGGKLSVLGAYAKSIKLSKEYLDQKDEPTEEASSERVAAWKSKYSEEGVATQTKEDLICPGCGQIFPPILHVRFLDHFEKCQSKGYVSSKKALNLLSDI